MREWMDVMLVVTCALLVACGDGGDGGEDGSSSGGDVSAGPCVVRYADNDEIAERGRLVQLDITFRYAATRTAQMAGDGVSMTLEAQSSLEGKASQLACAWDEEGGAVRYELDRVDGENSRPFPRTQAGKARLAGTRVTQADGKTIREEVDITGPLELLAVQDVGIPESAEDEVCVILAYDAPMRGMSRQQITAPGIAREEPMDPSGLVLDSYSALSPRTYDDGDHHFVDQAFAICTGKEAAEGGVGGSPRGLSISPDGRLWQRKGAWQWHPSRPLEQRTVEFTMRVVEPTLRLD